MIKKFRSVPVHLLQLEALLRRLSVRHPARNEIENEFVRRSSGYRGEQSLDYYLRQIPRSDHFIFQDIRLPHARNGFFQIDTLLLSSRYFIIFEAKNIAGSLHFDEHQLLRTYQETEEAFPNPIVQAENQQFHMENFIKNHLNIRLPSASFVVVTNNESIIKYDPNYRKSMQRVIRPPAIRQNTEMMMNKFRHKLLKANDLERLNQLISKFVTPPSLDISSKFPVKGSHILPGMHCSNCKSLSVLRLNTKWRCRNCRQVDDKAPIHALMDYSLLKSRTITNRQCREFLRIPSISITSKLLTSLQLPYRGTYKDRTYHLSLEQLQKWL